MHTRTLIGKNYRNRYRRLLMIKQNKTEYHCSLFHCFLFSCKIDSKNVTEKDSGIGEICAGG